jgi:hypothetical protein
VTVKRHFDGRHHVDDISRITGVPVDDVREIARPSARAERSRSTSSRSTTLTQ